MKTSTKTLYIGISITGLVAGIMLLLLPTLIEADNLSTDMTSWQHLGVYLSEPDALRETPLLPGDRIIRINDCTIEEHLSSACGTSRIPGWYTLDIIRVGQLLNYASAKSTTLRQTIQTKQAAFLGAMAMLVCSFIVLINIKGVAFFPQLLVIFLLFMLAFLFEVVQLPIPLILFPNIFWIYFALYILTQTSIRAFLLNLILVYPQQRFKKNRSRQIIFITFLTLPPIILFVVLLSAPNLITGIFRVNQWLAYYSYLLLVIYLLTIFYHLRHTHRPMVNLRVRWILIGAIAVGLLLIVMAIILVSSIENVWDSVSLMLDNPTGMIQKPHTLALLILFAPIIYAIPLGERYPRKIDNIENRILFYLMLSAILLIVYAVGILLVFQFDFSRIFQNLYVYFGLGLTVAVMLVLAFMRTPINRLINRWFYRDRLRYQTLLPGFILELSSNLNYKELLQLLLEKIPKEFEISSTLLMLRQPGGENFGMISPDSIEPKEQFSRNHPLIQHFHTTRKPILRYLDQKLLHPGIYALMEKLSLEAAIPLIHLGNLVGVYFLRQKDNGKPYMISELNVLTELDEWVGTAVYNTWVVSEKEDYYHNLELEMEMQSQELNRVVDETRKFRRTRMELSQHKETILGQVHQDLREPLNSISALTTLLSHNLGVNNQQQLRDLSSLTSLLTQRLDTFLDYSEVQSGKFQTKATLCNLSDLFDAIISKLNKDTHNITEAVSFHIEANTPMIVSLDATRLHQILVHLIQITLHTFPKQAFVITCAMESSDIEGVEVPHNLSFICKSQPDAILLHQVKIIADQPLLKMELVQQLLLRMDGEMRRSLSAGDTDFPFHFVLHADIPSDSYPAYMAVDLPFFKGKKLIICEPNLTELKQMTLHASTWGLEVTAITEMENLPNILSEIPEPDLMMLNETTSSEITSSLNENIRTIFYNNGEANEDSEGKKGLSPITMYNLIAKALLFSTTAEQYPFLPRDLNFSETSITEGKYVTVVGENENLNNIVLYLSRFNLETILYEKPLNELSQHLAENKTDILIFELSTKEQDEWKILEDIRKQDYVQPFIIATSANPIRFPALDVLQAGADKYLLKPYDLEELLTMIAEWLNCNASEK
jgi:CheY-like chemotaxis protein